MATVALLGRSTAVAVPKILCIGRNYAEHAKEMKADVPKEPVFFLKPATAIVHEGGSIVIPPISSDLHHEAELTVLLGTGGRDIPEESALTHVAGYGVGLDMTLRDIQARAKEKGLPWSLAKGFDTSAPISNFVPTTTIVDPSALIIDLSVNESMRQVGHVSEMLFPVPRLIAYLSRFILLEAGDIIFTGTPEGVARAVPGDRLVARLRRSDGTALTSLCVAVQ